MAEKRQYQAEEPPRRDFVDWIQGIQNHFGRFAFDIGGVLLFAFALMTLLALLGLTGGSLLTPWALTLRRWLGYGSLFIIIIAGMGGLALMRKPVEGQERINWWRVSALEIAVFFSLALMAIIGGTSVERAEAGQDGGYTGWALAQLLGRIIPNYEVQIFLVLMGLLAFALLGLKLLPKIEAWLLKFAGETIPPASLAEEGADILLDTKLHPMVDPSQEQPVEPAKRTPAPLPLEFRKNFKVPEAQDEKPVAPQPRSESLPPFSMLLLSFIHAGGLQGLTNRSILPAVRMAARMRGILNLSS